MAALADRFARRGYVTASINYRLASRDAVDPSLPTFSKPALSQAVANATKDARAALRWLRANATKYRVHKQRIAIGGGSAGAFTALHVAYSKGEGEGGRPGFSSEVGAVVDFWGGLLDANEMKAGGPPLLITHGTQDKMVPFTFAEELVARAKEVGVPYEFHPLEGEGHAAWLPMDRHVRSVAEFLYHHMIEMP
jgi:acetyl esterase/lipase